MVNEQMQLIADQHRLSSSPGKWNILSTSPDVARDAMHLPRRTALILILASVFAGHAASAQTVITTCKNIVGKSLTPPADWEEDGITDGFVTVSRTGKRYDLIIKGSVGLPFSALGDGAEITKIEGDNDKDFTLALTYPLGQVDVYRFHLDATGRGVMLWAMLKNRADRGAIFSAQCGPK